MFFGKKKFTTVDIGSHSIKVARLSQKKDEVEVIDTGLIELPADTISEGEIEDHSIVATELETLFKDMNYHPKRIVTTVSTNNLLIRNLEMPVMSEKELAESIKWEADEQLPFSAERASLDYMILEQDENNMKILLVAVKQDIINNFLEPFDKLGMKPEVVNVQPMALLSLLEYQGELTEPSAIIDIGASRTQVTIGNKRNINLSRTISTGGFDFTDSIMESRGLDFHGAEGHKIEHGIKEEKKEENTTGDEFDLDSVQIAATGMGGDVLKSLAVTLAEEISRSLDFYSMKHRGRRINKVFITGGGSRLKGLKEIIIDEIDQDLLILDPFKNVNTDQQPEYRDEFAVAIGLGVSEVIAE